MDATGDTRHEFNPADPAAVAKAEARFKELTGAGFTAAVRRGEGRSELVRTFDPAADETVFFPRWRPTYSRAISVSWAGHSNCGSQG
jgi:hypothetical protein